MSKPRDKSNSRSSIDLLIRPFTPSDQKAAKNLILEGLSEHFDIIDRCLNPDLDDINAYYIAQGEQFLVAEIDNKLVGTGGLIQESDAVGRIVRVSVASSHRRLGIGRKIAEYLISIAPNYGYSQLVVETNEDWFDAIRLYQRCGFSEYDRHDGEVHLEKNL